MRRQSRSLPYRWILPVVELFVCAIVIWPFLFPTVKFDPLHPYKQRWIPNTGRRLEMPVLINLPVALATLPCVLIDRAETKCVPKGMTIEGWRAISFPLVGLIFWWIVGRAVEALVSARQDKVDPSIGWMEISVSIVVLGFGLFVFVVNIVESNGWINPFSFPMAASSASWTVLGSLTIAARVAQRRIMLRQRDGMSIQKSPP